jgi:hypothetical protein
MTREEYTRGLNQILMNHGISLDVRVDDLSFTPQVVTDARRDDAKISTALARHLSPPIHSGEFYHYTSVADLITVSNVLRLTSVKKRITEEEIAPFLNAFGFDYPLELDPTTTLPRYTESIASRLFYTSFTPIDITPDEEKYFWRTFAGPKGARLRVRITAGSGCVRRIVYGDAITKVVDLYKAIADYTRVLLDKVFYWDNSAIISGLCLPLKLGHEQEVRLITTPESGFPRGSEKGIDYLELRLGTENPMNVRLDLVEIQTDNSAINLYPKITIPRTT